MKKILCFVMLILISASLCSCHMSRSPLLNSDGKIADNCMNNVLSALVDHDAEKLKSLFSPNAIEAADAFDDSIEELLAYFDATSYSIEEGGPRRSRKSRDRDNADGPGRELQYIEMSYDVKTDKDGYRFAIQYYVRDTADVGNLGIRSLLVNKANEDGNTIFAYWGDHQFNAGIRVGVKNDLSKTVARDSDH